MLSRIRENQYRTGGIIGREEVVTSRCRRQITFEACTLRELGYFPRRESANRQETVSNESDEESGTKSQALSRCRWLEIRPR